MFVSVSSIRSCRSSYNFHFFSITGQGIDLDYRDIEWFALETNRDCLGLTETEDIKKSWQEYTEELYKKDLHEPDNHNDVITHLEPDILECEVKWALESITTNKASGGEK